MAHGWGGKRRGSGRKKKSEQPISRTQTIPRQQPQPRAPPSDEDQDRQFQDSMTALARLAEEAEQRIQFESGPGEDVEDDDDDDDDDDWGDDDDDDDDVAGDSEDDDSTTPDQQQQQEVQQQRVRARSKYTPPLHSFVAQILSSKNKIIGKDPAAKNGRHWYFPEEDPVSVTARREPKPEDWYRNNIVCFNWAPFTQYSALVGNLQTDYCCVHCKKKCLKSNGYYWRIAFDFSRIVWVRHRRLQCDDSKGKGGCGKTFAEIDPRFLQQLPDRIIETLPFLTRAKGPCMTAQMIYAFMAMAVKGILYGTFCSIFNELFYINHSVAHLGYLDALSDFLMTGTLARLGILPQTTKHVFAPFKSPGEYNGIELSPRHVKYYFLQVCRVLEPYRQRSLQKDVDEGASPDHTHKFASNIKIPGRSGNAFSASYTVMSLNGLVNISALTHTKSNAEVDSIVQGYKRVRENAGEPRLRRLELDGGSDRHVWTKHFKDDLNKDVVPYFPSPAESLAEAGISNEQFQFFEDRSAANDWARAVYNDIATNKDKILVIFDLEWPLATEIGEDTSTRTCQTLVYNERTKETVIAVLDLWAMHSTDRDSFPKSFRDLLLYPNAMLVAHNPGNDVARLSKLGVDLKHWIDIRQLALQLPDNLPASGTGLRSLAAQYLGLDVDKSLQRADWTTIPLPRGQIEYAAKDTLVTLKLYSTLSEMLKREGGTFATRNQSRSDVVEGATAILKHGRQQIAVVEIVSVGGVNGRQFKWGSLTIGKGKAIVRLKRVIVKSARAPFHFRPSATERDRGIRGWGTKDQHKKLVEILEMKGRQEPLIAVSQSSLRVMVSPPTNLSIATSPGLPSGGNASASETVVGVADTRTIEATVDTSVNDATNLAPPGTERTTGNATSALAVAGYSDTFTSGTGTKAGNATSSTAASMEFTGTNIQTNESYDSFWNLIDEEDENSADGSVAEAIRSRDKNDIFHIFQEVPLGKKCPARPLIVRLLIHATYKFDDEDYANITRVLEEKHNIRGKVEVLRHFYHNREWWRKRCRVYTPSAQEHGDLIDEVHGFVQKEDLLRNHYTPELRQYFLSLSQKCRSGKFEELPDVSLYQYDGTDSNGLNMYLRKRGSTKAENFHQKLWAAFGPWSIGVETGHHLMLLVSYRYNVHTAIRRCNAHDFGHTHLHLLDRIDLRLQELFGICVYPRHFNVLLFDGVKNFVCAGISPLLCDERFVKRGLPDSRLNGDLKFMAQKQQVQCPPLPIATQIEHKMFNDFLRRHPKPTKKQLEELAVLFLNKTDCIDVFPKLLSHLASAYKKHRENHIYRKYEMQLGKGFDALLHKLAAPVQRGDNITLQESEVDNLAESPRESTDARSNATMTDSTTTAVANVPPVGAPGQKRPVSTSSFTGKQRRCFYWPRCMDAQTVCGGYAADRCSNISSGKIAPPTMKELEAEKRLARNELKAEAMRRKRQKK